ncbi:MAG: hypothetical protein EZS28_023523 [Streblomastix strix]|uniref:Uncharacterized protein n=1 Tax=Streblomastix strix TaxID=222440 RepID=A0A5J4VER6_9EUKA|nr:MAG: hypothetical protein EZS28_023523 [Streblomastix strix]
MANRVELDFGRITSSVFEAGAAIFANEPDFAQRVTKSFATVFDRQREQDEPNGKSLEKKIRAIDEIEDYASPIIMSATPIIQNNITKASNIIDDFLKTRNKNPSIQTRYEQASDQLKLKYDNQSLRAKNIHEKNMKILTDQLEKLQNSLDAKDDTIPKEQINNEDNQKGLIKEDNQKSIKQEEDQHNTIKEDILQDISKDKEKPGISIKQNEKDAFSKVTDIKVIIGNTNINADTPHVLSNEQ